MTSGINPTDPRRHVGYGPETVVLDPVVDPGIVPGGESTVRSSKAERAFDKEQKKLSQAVQNAKSKLHNEWLSLGNALFRAFSGFATHFRQERHGMHDAYNKHVNHAHEHWRGALKRAHSVAR